MAYDYLCWDAQSIQELLRRKLLETGLLTDQLYPSSDTKILMDLFAWVFDVLTYMLNNNTSDVLFADTQLYENMNRLVKLLSYSPRGYITSSVECQVFVNHLVGALDSGMYTIPKFSYIDIGKFDKYGYPIRYSFVEDFTFNVYKNDLISYVVTPDVWPVIYNRIF
jgi:hypothetical protein